jgi:hypothetical protein
MKNVIIVKKALLILNVEGFIENACISKGFNIYSRKDVLHSE